MSTKFSWSIFVMLVALTTGSHLIGQADQATPTTPPPAHSAGGATANSPEGHLQMLSEKLNLTDDQKTKLRPIMQDEAQQLRAVHDDTSLSPEQKSAKMKAIRETFHKQINTVLTPEQQAKLKQMQQEAMEKHKAMKEGQMEHQ
jgi:Spy/CpxP family protein refolding chaperone